MAILSSLVGGCTTRWDKFLAFLSVNENGMPFSSPGSISVLPSKAYKKQYSTTAFKCILILILCLASVSVCHGLIPPGKILNHKLRPFAPTTSSCLQVVETELPLTTVSTTATDGVGVLPLDFENGVVNTDIDCSVECATSGNNDEDEKDVQEDAESASIVESSRDASDDTVKRRLKSTAKAAALADRRRRRGDASTASRTGKSTSVGSRRIGSATKARRGLSSIDKLTDAIRKGSTSYSVGDRNKQNKQETKPPSSIDDIPGGNPQNSFFGPVNQSTIHAAVAEMLDPSGSLGIRPKAAQEIAEDDYGVSSTPEPGTILIPAVSSKDGRTTFAKRAASDRLTVRLATRFDDFDIANLRLSVFSNFTPAVRKTFCSKSCQLLASRRSRGATCIVATVPRYGSILSPRQDIILGSAECSFHEFHGTTLGASRPQNSLLYITEVAVSPTARRQGIGMKMMQAIDKLASIRAVESAYLHVDVSNELAISLYERNGYEIINSSHPMYHEFTKSLNLHDGATQGRNHFLMTKHYTHEPTWLQTEDKNTHAEAALGFEIMV